MGNCMPLPCTSRRISAWPSSSSRTFPPNQNRDKPARIRAMGLQSPSKRRRHAPMTLHRILGRETGDLRLYYDLGKELGSGRFGVIRECKNKHTGELFACKSISKLKFKRMNDVEDVRREIDIMRDLSAHPNVVKLRDVYEDKAYIHLVMELCEGGDLFDRVVKRRAYPESEAAVFFKILVEVVKYCHERGVIHRDLKPENILVVNGTPSSAIKLADFGLALRFTPGEKFSRIAGSAYYVAPEILNGDYSKEIDVWSAGVILYILLCGVPPFWGDTDQRIFEAIKKGKIDFTSPPWENISLLAKDLLSRMLCPNPKARITAAQVLKHPWVVHHTTQSEQEDGRSTGQDIYGKASACNTNDGENVSGASPCSTETMEEISAVHQKTLCLTPTCSLHLQFGPEFEFQNEANGASEIPVESTVCPCSFTQRVVFASFRSLPSSFSTKSPNPDRLASFSQVGESTRSEFLAAVETSVDTSHHFVLSGSTDGCKRNKPRNMYDCEG